MMPENLRLPSVAGRFYTADPATLKAEVEQYLAAGQAKAATPGAAPVTNSRPDTVPAIAATPGSAPAIAVIAPHAGYVFSGAVTGLVLGQVAVPQTVILLGPNHTGQGAALSVWPGGAWATPLGACPVDAALGAELCANTRGAAFKPDTAAHLREHSLEVMLPFLQAIRPDVKILPICVAEYDPAKLAAAGAALANCVMARKAKGEHILLLGSTDMSHHIPHSQAEKLDAMALREIGALNPEGLYSTVRGHKISMCGIAPITLLLHACRALGATESRLAAYTTSGITGASYGAGMDQVVGYAGIIIK